MESSKERGVGTYSVFFLFRHRRGVSMTGRDPPFLLYSTATSIDLLQRAAPIRVLCPAVSHGVYYTPRIFINLECIQGHEFMAKLAGFFFLVGRVNKQVESTSFFPPGWKKLRKPGVPQQIATREKTSPPRKHCSVFLYLLGAFAHYLVVLYES